jgi:hypothetical protein
MVLWNATDGAFKEGFSYETIDAPTWDRGVLRDPCWLCDYPYG